MRKFSEKTDLKKHMDGTYKSVRNGIAILTIAFPVILIFGGLSSGVSLQTALSAYYHASYDEISIECDPEDQDCIKKAKDNYANYHASPEGRWFRLAFVGFLLSLGALLFFYKGFSPLENWALNLGGISAALVAFFPMEWTAGEGVLIYKAVEFAGGLISMHGLAAVVLVLCVAVVCLFCSNATLNYVQIEAYRKRYRITYNILGGLMIILPLLVVFLSSFLGKDRLILWLEIVVLIVFATFWLVKSFELSHVDKNLLLQQESDAVN